MTSYYSLSKAYRQRSRQRYRNLRFRPVAALQASQQRAEALRRLMVCISATSDLQAAFELVLAAVCSFEGVDSGGVYVRNQDDDSLELVIYRGLTEAFAQAAGHYDRQTSNVEKLLAGQPLYAAAALSANPSPAILAEGLKAIAAIPILYQGELRASLNVGSHTIDDFLPATRLDLEAVAAQVGGALVRIYAEERVRQSEERLQASEERYRTLVDNFKFGIIRSTLDGKFLYANQTIAEMGGYENPEEFLEIPAQQRYVDLSHRQHMLELLKQQGMVKDIEIHSVRKDGSRFWVSLSAVLLRDEQGRPESLLGFVSDITDRKRAEQLLQARVRLREFAASHVLDELLQETLAQAKTITSSQIGFLGLLQPDQQTPALQIWSSHSLEKEHPLIQNGAWMECVRRRQVVVYNDYAAVPYQPDLPAGHVPLSRHLVAPVIRDEKIVAILGVCNKPFNYNPADVLAVQELAELAWDILAQQRAQEALRVSEQHFRSYYELGLIGMAISTPDKRWVQLNDRLCEMLGYTRQELADLTWDQVTHPDDLLLNAKQLERMMAGEIDRFTLDKRFIRKDGSVIYTILSAHCLRRPDGSMDHMVGMMQDITERKQAEAQIRSALQEKEVLLRELYHRTRNNMQVISAMLTLQSEQSQDEALQGVLLEMDNRIRSMALVHEKLYQSRNLSRINLGAYVEDLAYLVLASYGATGARITLHLDLENIPATIDLATPCGLVVNEILSNALKYAFPGQRRGEIRVCLQRQPDGQIRLSIADNGVGMESPEALRGSRTLGVQTVLGITEHQLSARVTLETRGGVSWEVIFDDSRYQTRV